MALALALALVLFAGMAACPCQAVAAQVDSGQQLGARTAQHEQKGSSDITTMAGSKKGSRSKDVVKAAELAPKIVMIGDSYSIKSAKRKVANPWPERVSKSLGISAANRYIYRASGFGFAKPGKRFIQLVAKKAQADESVTDVLIVGGAGNDRFCSKAQITFWYKLTIGMLKRMYPNATIMHTITSWDSKNLKYQELIVEHLPWYRKLAKKCGVTYLPGCETIMRTHYEYFSKDHRHPTEAGQRAISNKIVKKIRRYNPRYAATARAKGK